MSTIGLFNFVEDHIEPIVDEVCREIRQRLAAAGGDALKKLVADVLEGYIDLLVTGQTDELEPVYREALLGKEVQPADLIEFTLLPSRIGATFERLYADELTSSRPEDPDLLLELDRAMAQIEETSRQAVCKLHDVIQERLDAPRIRF